MKKFIKECHDAFNKFKTIRDGGEGSGRLPKGVQPETKTKRKDYHKQLEKYYIERKKSFKRNK
jgi:hypothetical protein